MNEIVRDYRRMKDDYAFDGSVMCNDDERVRAVKRIIAEKLNTVDRTIIIMYMDLQSLRKLGKRFGVSHATMRTEVNRIKQIILKEYGRYADSCGGDRICH